MFRVSTYFLLSAALGIASEARSQEVEDVHPADATSEADVTPDLNAARGTNLEPAPVQNTAAPVQTPNATQPGAWEHRLANGLHLVGQQDTSHERSALCVSYRAGSLYDPQGFEGLALLTQRLHDNGITPRFSNGIRTSFPHTLPGYLTPVHSSPGR